MSQIIRHPDYNPNTFDNDICLLRLSSTVTFTNFIVPVCLAADGSVFSADTDVWVTGWGNTNTDGETNDSGGVATAIVLLKPLTFQSQYNYTSLTDVGTQVVTASVFCFQPGFLECGTEEQCEFPSRSIEELLREACQKKKQHAFL